MLEEAVPGLGPLASALLLGSLLARAVPSLLSRSPPLAGTQLTAPDSRRGQF